MQISRFEINVEVAHRVVIAERETPRDRVQQKEMSVGLRQMREKLRKLKHGRNNAKVRANEGFFSFK